MTKLEYLQWQLEEIKKASMEELQLQCAAIAIENARKPPVAVLEPDPIIWFLLRKLVAVDRERPAAAMKMSPSALTRQLRDFTDTRKADMYAALVAWRNSEEVGSGREEDAVA